MKNRLVLKIIFAVVFIFLISVGLQLLLQKFFLEDLYKGHKIHNEEESLSLFAEELDFHQSLDEQAKDFESGTGYSLILLDENKHIINESFFENFNTITLGMENGEEVRVIVDDLVDDRGEMRDRLFKVGDTIQVSGVLIKDTQIVDPSSILVEENMEIFLPNISEKIGETQYGEEEDYLQTFKGTVEEKDFVQRGDGIFSYQSQRLLQEVMVAEGQTVRDFGQYEFIEETTGVSFFVEKQTVENKGHKVSLYSLMALGNVKDAGKMLNTMSLYFLLFQFVLILLLSVVFSRWFTKPLLQLIRQADEIANLDFTTESKVKHKDELLLLSSSLNQISSNLSHTIDSLKESNEKWQEEAMEKARREEALRNLLANVSHEYKTPLGIISGFMQIIRDGAGEKDRDYYFDTVEGEIKKLDELLIETMELARIGESHSPLDMMAFSLDQLIEETFKRFFVEIEKKKLSSSLDLYPVRVLGDRGKIERVLNNLFSNGVKYTKERGNLSVGCKEVGEEIEISVTNSGDPLSQRDLENIFTPFYRGTSYDGNASEGTGLGLSIVKSILDHHKSKLTVENTADGITFTFSLKKADLDT